MAGMTPDHLRSSQPERPTDTSSQADGTGLRGRASPRYGTGRTPLTNGYMRVWKPGHPLAGTDGYVLEHRFVMHAAGIEIPAGFHVHHRNGDKIDNRLENLELKSAGDHAREHIRAAGVIVNQFGVHPLKTKRPCARCGAAFMPWTKAGKFCSRSCANRTTAPLLGHEVAACA